jgi:glycosyltransferase involved in cell wall biosynthesis
MKIALVTDTWTPQVNGVVTTLVALVEQLRAKGHEVEVIQPYQFKTTPCPGYKGIDLALGAGKAVATRLASFEPDSIHLATEGPLGWAARGYCLKQQLAFTTAFHTRFPELLHAALRLPLSWGYALFRHFHKPSRAVMVPTKGVRQLLSNKGFKQVVDWTHGVDTNLFAYHARPINLQEFATLPRPIALCVGRVSYEKNTEAFLQMPWGGSKVVCGEGPLEDGLKQRYPSVQWLGVLPRDKLAKIYAAADVFVMPSKHETFGLVLLEAMSSGTPVAAYPVDGPLEVMRAKLSDIHLTLGGKLGDDLSITALQALRIARSDARAQALTYRWSEAADSFIENLFVNTAARSHTNVT